MVEVLIFMVDSMRFGILVTKTDHVVRMVQITRIEATAKTVVGLINYHGTILPVFSLRSRFMLPDRAPDLDDLLIIISGSRKKVALIAEQIDGTIDIAEDLITTEGIVPGMIGLQGVVKTTDGIILITDPEHFLLPDEETSLTTILNSKSGGIS